MNFDRDEMKCGWEWEGDVDWVGDGIGDKSGDIGWGVGG